MLKSDETMSSPNRKAAADLRGPPTMTVAPQSTPAPASLPAAPRRALPLQSRPNSSTTDAPNCPPPAAQKQPPSPQALEPPPAAKRRRTSATQTRSWNDMLYDLLKFRAERGHCRVPYKGTGALGKWVARQRQLYQMLQAKEDDSKPQADSLELNVERIQVLNSLSFVWDVVQADHDERWNERFAELAEYAKVHGHCLVPQSTPLGQWVKMQRENKKEADLKAAGMQPQRAKQRPCLSQERIAKLDSIGFAWRVSQPVVGWENRYEQLVEYKRLHGNCNVPQSYPPDKSFGRWVMKQRCEQSLKLRGEKSQLTDEREARLNALGFSWVAPNFRKKTVTMPQDEEEEQQEEQDSPVYGRTVVL